IYSAMSGKVVYVGWSNIFGNYVIINHGNGYQSLYGHMSKTLCRTGKTVAQGEKIGLVGSTGYSTGPHLHFTVYKNGKLVDPMTLLKR
ncbi:MAG: M23 family metallopeptidase, partial [Treponema sp.]|nr:M23 family metallopeptidase [Treponema sp.]